MKFWILWSVDAVIALIAVGFFFIGIADGSVSSFNIGHWTILLLALGGVVGGSLLLRSARRQALAMSLVVVLAVPGLLIGVFFLALVVLAPDWR